jgi:tetratricopeptide (TPR) repeat protein
MAANPAQCKKNLAGVNSLLKQGKLLSAVTSLRDGLECYVRSNLLKHEKEEIAEQLEWAVYQLGSDRKFKEIYPLKIIYAPGKEKELLETTKEIVGLLSDENTKEAQEQIAQLQQQRLERLLAGQELLDNQEFDEARTWFDRLCRDYEHDIDLKVDVSDRFLKAELYDDAIRYLKAAFKDDPRSPHVFNKLAIALRKSGRFEEAEKFFQLALKTSLKDEFLYFNLGRVYIDWKKWPKALEAAEQALALNPDFEEAAKMKAFAQKMMAS